MSVWWLLPLAVSVVYLCQFIIRFMQSKASGSGKPAISPEEYRTFKLIAKVASPPTHPSIRRTRTQDAVTSVMPALPSASCLHCTNQ